MKTHSRWLAATGGACLVVALVWHVFAETIDITHSPVREPTRATNPVLHGLPSASSDRVDHRPNVDDSGTSPSQGELFTGTSNGLEYFIHGRVENASGDPVSRVTVRAEEGVGYGGVSGEDGTFRVRVERAGKHSVCANISGVFFGEANADVTIAKDGTSDSVLLRFDDACSVSGHALLPDGRPANGVLVKIALRDNELGLGSFAVFMWSSGDAHSWLSSRTDERGAFGFAGVDRRSVYRLWWMGDDGTHQSNSNDVTGGMTNLRVVIDRHRLLVVARDKAAGKEVPAEVDVYDTEQAIQDPDSLDNALNCESEWDEPTWVAPPERTLRIVARCPGYSIVDTTYVMTSSPGEQILEIELEPLGESAELRVACVDPQGRRMAGVPLGFYYVGSDSKQRTRLKPSVDSTGEIPIFRGVPACRLRIESGELNESSHWETWKYFLPAHVDVETPSSGGRDVTLSFKRGGLLKIQISDPPVRGHYMGEYLLHYALRNEQGQVVPTMWYDTSASHKMGGDGCGVISSKDVLVSNAIPAGFYRLTLSTEIESYELGNVTVPIEIRVGEITRKTIQLVREARWPEQGK